MFTLLNNRNSITFLLTIFLIFINVSFAYYFDSFDDYPVKVNQLEMYKKIHSKPQSMYFFYPARLNWAVDKTNFIENKGDISSNKNKRSNLNENKSDDNESILNGRNIRSPLGTMRFGKRGKIYDIPMSDEEFNSWIIYNKRTAKPNPLGTMRFGK
ncbi:FMRFamide-related peptide-like family-containing protein [Strongyloides ratti]|uniref:FMRFamide-related peptide-like family-containing protein n=1 Tax=Strongyloides ratti TaxID=34506 RepID=A0A090KW09_STRRB|nr:FMRFamide-related peptide-like family-containing protein [Strongyloides ratti]CEF59457.1 FMRFamide-related peptide-like family-containing protein [Strongyloides ratti]